MKHLTREQFESLKRIVDFEFPLQGLSFNSPYEINKDEIDFVVLERYDFKMKIIYVIVPLALDEQFNKLNKLEQLTKELFISSNANFGYFGICSFEGDAAIYLNPTVHQFERLK